MLTTAVSCQLSVISSQLSVISRGAIFNQAFRIAELGSLLVLGAQHPSFDPVYEGEAKFDAFCNNFMVRR